MSCIRTSLYQNGEIMRSCDKHIRYDSIGQMIPLLCGFRFVREPDMQCCDLTDQELVTLIKGTKSRGATRRSVHESLDSRPGNQTKLTVDFFVKTERTSSKLTFREKPITGWQSRTTNPQIHSPPFFPCAIATAVGPSVKPWFLSQTDFPICRPRLSLLKPEGEAVELWLENISL